MKDGTIDFQDDPEGALRESGHRFRDLVVERDGREQTTQFCLACGAYLCNNKYVAEGSNGSAIIALRPCTPKPLAAYLGKPIRFIPAASNPLSRLLERLGNERGDAI
jgi:hypothetical protein